MDDRERFEQIDVQSYAAALAIHQAERATGHDSHRLYRQAEISLQQLRDLITPGPVGKDGLEKDTT